MYKNILPSPEGNTHSYPCSLERPFTKHGHVSANRIICRAPLKLLTLTLVDLYNSINISSVTTQVILHIGRAVDTSKVVKVVTSNIVKMSSSSGIMRFGTVDYVVFGVMLFISVAIGIYYALTGGKQKTTVEFLLANRKMMAIPIGLSLLASFMSAITILGVPAEMYTFGTQYWMIIISYIFLFPIVALVFVPVFRAVDITSSYEVFIKQYESILHVLCISYARVYIKNINKFHYIINQQFKAYFFLVLSVI